MLEVLYLMPIRKGITSHPIKRYHIPSHSIPSTIHPPTSRSGSSRPRRRRRQRLRTKRQGQQLFQPQDHKAALLVKHEDGHVEGAELADTNVTRGNNVSPGSSSKTPRSLSVVPATHLFVSGPPCSTKQRRPCPSSLLRTLRKRLESEERLTIACTCHTDSPAARYPSRHPAP